MKEEHKTVSERTREIKEKWLNGEPVTTEIKIPMSLLEKDKSVRFQHREVEHRENHPVNIHKIARIPTRNELKTLTHFAKRPAISIDFADLSYTVRNHSGGKCNCRKYAEKIRLLELSIRINTNVRVEL